MVVALGTAHGEAEPDGSHGIRPINHLLNPVLLRVCAAFAISQRVPVKSGSYALIDSCIGKQIPGDLLNCEAIKRHVTVQRIDDPVAIAPCIRSIFVLAE